MDCHEQLDSFLLSPGGRGSQLSSSCCKYRCKHGGACCVEEEGKLLTQEQHNLLTSKQARTSSPSLAAAREGVPHESSTVNVLPSTAPHTCSSAVHGVRGSTDQPPPASAALPCTASSCLSTPMLHTDKCNSTTVLWSGWSIKSSSWEALPLTTDARQGEGFHLCSAPTFGSGCEQRVGITC